MALPQFLQPYLWSYDIKKMDPQRSKETIITQVLNYGDSKAVKWLFETYTVNEVKEVLRKPRRGIWFKDAIDYWSRIFNVNVDPWHYKFCLFTVYPKPELYAEFFKNKPLPINTQ